MTLDVTNPEEDLGDGVSIQKLDLGAGAVHSGNLMAVKLQDGEAHLRRGQEWEQGLEQELEQDCEQELEQECEQGLEQEWEQEQEIGNSIISVFPVGD